MRPPRIDVEKCTGCRACEIACSVHLTGAASPASSAIKVSRSNHTAEITWTIDQACDLCPGEPQALCLKFCTAGAIVLGEPAEQEPR